MASLALEPCTMHVPEIPGTVIEFYPQFIQGSQMVLWRRQDFMKHFDVTIRESAQSFTVTAVDPNAPEAATPGFTPVP